MNFFSWPFGADENVTLALRGAENRAERLEVENIQLSAEVRDLREKLSDMRKAIIAASDALLEVDTRPRDFTVTVESVETGHE